MDEKSGLLNSPMLTKTNMNSELKDENRAIKDAEQAANLVKRLVEANRDRNQKNTRIMAKYNAERPFNQSELASEGLSWKSNFSTKILSSLIDKVSPRFTTVVHKVRYLTSSSLPDTIPDAAKKSEFFQREITKTCRARRGWKDLIAEIAQENALFGFAAVTWTDEYSWMPHFYRQDEFFVPVGTKQGVDSLPLFVCKQTFLIHEFFDHIRDKKAAEDAGWHIENAIEVINNAMPEARQSTWGSDSMRVYEDLNRECSISASYSEGAKQVVAYSVFVVELTGKVSHWMVGGTDFKELFVRTDRFDTMADCVSFFSFQQANGTLHGSKGIGREVYGMAGALERSRNEAVDRLQLSGKIILKAEDQWIKRFKMSVIGNAILINSNFQVDQFKLDSGVEPFFALDNYISGLLDQIAGSSSPKVFEGERVTKAAVDLFSSREDERRDVTIERFLSQFADMMSTIQKRLCSPKITDDDAKELRERLLKVLSKEEIKTLANQPAVSTVSDYTNAERQAVSMIASENRGNPLYNQVELERRKMTALVNSAFADAVIIAQPDPTVAAEQSRMQQMENMLLAIAQPVPVSPRDNHRVHLDLLKEALTVAGQAAADDAAAIPNLEAFVMHGVGHIQAALQAGAKKEEYAEDMKLLEGLKAGIEKMKQDEIQAAEQMQGQEMQPQAPIPQ